MPAEGIDPARVADLLEKERKAFVEARPRSAELLARGRAHMPGGVPMAWMAAGNDVPVYVTHAKGARFRDVDGFEYVDTNIADMSSFCGYGSPAIVEAIARRAAQGTQFLLPTEDAIWVAEELARRYPMPRWQFTLSASQANTEVIRVARAVTGREKILFFDGHYHGHFDEGTVELARGGLQAFGRGLPRDVADKVRVVPFNDARAVRNALEPRDVAIVLTEPALTNNLGLQLPEPGFHDALRRACSDTGTVLAYDETHTHVVGPGGCTGLWDLTPDAVSIGKSVAGGVPLGAYGLIGALADELEPPGAVRGSREIATGGTLFGNPLSMAAARAALGEVLLPEAYAHANALGVRLAEGLERAIGEVGLPWTAHRFGPRSGTTFAGAMPRNAEESRTSFDATLFRLLRLWLGNRGVWEAIVGAGPTMAVPATDADVDRYVDAYGQFVRALAG
jgi:glutamate-1-semialdehyde 2,1-aminomutase